MQEDRILRIPKARKRFLSPRNELALKLFELRGGYGDISQCSTISQPL